MRVLTYTHLFPNEAQPILGTFIRERMVRWAAHTGGSLEVVAPVPWFPSVGGFGTWSAMGRVARREDLDGIRVHHPRYLHIPKVGTATYPALMAAGSMRVVERLHAEQPFDLIDGHYLFHDGVAGALVAERLGIPFVLSARGSDALVLPESRTVRSALPRALDAAARLVAVSAELEEKLVELGADRSKIRVVPNGVDRSEFSPGDRASARSGLGLAEDGPLLVSVGRLHRQKGHDRVLRALALLRGAHPQLRWTVIGEGDERSALQALAREEGVADMVEFVGNRPHDTLCDWYRAADLHLLPSRWEGHPNVLCEAIACGLPSVAAPAGAVPETLDERTGIVLEDTSPGPLSQAILDALAREWDPAAFDARAAVFSWDATVLRLDQVFQEALAA